jgi:hypothetical protein
MRDLRLAALGAAPLLAGAVLPRSALADGGVWCPFRALTGLPCPLCGATRAFVEAGHLDDRFLRFGAVWVVVAVALVVAGLTGWRWRPARAWVVVAGLAAVAWAWALANAATIAPPG